MPADERLIVDYSCAWQKDILIQGRMYVSQHYLCFYANFLKWETSLSLKLKDVLSISREKTAKVIPNAIEIRSNKNEKYFFASFATRDKSYAAIFRIWQMVLLDQPMSSQHMWTLIHESYGNDLDMTTDEEDTYNKQPTNPTADKDSPKQDKSDANEKDSRVTPSSVYSKSSEKDEIDDRSSMSSRGGRHTDDDYDNYDDRRDLISAKEQTRRTSLGEQPSPGRRQPDPSPIVENSSGSAYLCKCSCQSHLATQLIDRTYSTSVERLFDYLFGENDFVAAYHESRRIKDYRAHQWYVDEKTSKRERVCTYRVGVTAVFGATTICSVEKQVIESELAGSCYIVDTEVRNQGIKYADAFYVASRYCLVQVGPNRSHLKVTCEVKYLKSLMIIIKSFIEKNAMAALQDSYTDLHNRIEQASSPTKRAEGECSARQRGTSAPLNDAAEKASEGASLTRRKQSQKTHSSKQNASADDSSSNQRRLEVIHREMVHRVQDSSLLVSASSDSLSPPGWSKTDVLLPLCLLIMLTLVGVNVFLLVKLNAIDRMTDHLVQSYPPWSNTYAHPKEEYQWSVLLKRQEEYYQAKLTNLRAVLMSTHNALKNVTEALNELTKATSGTSSNAPVDQLHSL